MFIGSFNRLRSLLSFHENLQKLVHMHTIFSTVLFLLLFGWVFSFFVSKLGESDGKRGVLKTGGDVEEEEERQSNTEWNHIPLNKT